MTMQLAQIFDAANTILAQKMSQVQGVGQVFVGGGQQPAVRVQADPRALAGIGMGMEQLRAQMVTATANSAKGAIGAGGVGELTTQVRTIDANDQMANAAMWKPLVIQWSGGQVRLGDIANVYDDVENARVAGWADGERTVLLIIRRQPGANILEVIERCKAILPLLVASISPAIDVQVALDRAQTIRGSVHDVEFSLMLSVALVVLVVFVFLRSLRATLIPSFAVPLSLIATFGIMYLLNYSLDNLSLMALTISTGFVVDDAIVVTENITRYIEEGMPPVKAALKGAQQIGFTIVSITCSLLAVFIPLLLMGGIVGRLFREFAVTLSIAITVSAVLSLTLTPMMCARLLRHEHGKKPGWLSRQLERGFDALQNGYGHALRFVLRHRIIVGGATVFTICLTVWLFRHIPFGLFPQQDTGLISGFADAPQDISFPAMKSRQEALNKIVQADPAVDHFVSFTGSGPGAGTTNTGSMFISLKGKPPRKESADDVINRLRPKLAKVEGINLFLQAVQDMRVGGRATRTQYQYTLEDASLAELNQWSPKMLKKLQGLPELRDVATDQQTAGLELDITVDRDTASRLGLTMKDIDSTLYDAYGQEQVGVYYTQLNQYHVVLEATPETMGDPSVLDTMYVKSAISGLVPLSTFSKVSTGSTLLSVNHQGQFPAVTLSFNTAPGIALGTAVDAIHKAEREMGVPASIHAAFQGTAQAYKDSLSSEIYLIIAAILTVYIVLGMLYESYIHPITILSTLPSAGVGALLALLLVQMELSIVALVGIILLIGIVKKNAIMMIDFAIETERDEGLSPEESIYKACLLRFRPILMTTMAALLGGLPLAFGTGMGAELRRPLGITIVGGLIVSQLLTLFTTPVTYLFLDRFSNHRDRPDEGPAPPASSVVPPTT